MQQRKRKMGKPRGKVTRAARGGGRGTKDSLVRIPPVPKGRNFLPIQTRSELTWSLNGVLNNVGVVYTNTYVQMNYPGVPILGASTTPGGWTDLVQLYQSIRVLSCNVKFEATNKEAFPITMFQYRVGQTTASGATPAANDITNPTTLRGATENPTFRDKQLGIAASGTSVGTVRSSTHLSTVIGTPWPGSVDEYSGTSIGASGVVPTAILFQGYGIYATDIATVLVNGVAYRISVVYDCVFFQPRHQGN